MLIAIAEDDASLRRSLSRGLEEEGFDVVAVERGSELVERATGKAPDAFVIDIGLPDSDGRDVCQALRARGIGAPVLFLTARGALTDRLAGFHAGGDDYLTKPFAFDELVVRLRALLRRSGGDSDIEVEGLRFSPAEHAIVLGDRSVPLTPTEYRLLATLAARPGHVVRRRELVASAWPEGAIVHDNTIDAYIARLRRKLRELGSEGAIVTAHGVGYRLR